MLRSKRNAKAILVMLGVIGVSSILNQCTLAPTASPAQAAVVTQNTVAITEVTQTVSMTSFVPPSTSTVITTPTRPTMSSTPDAPILPPGGPRAATNLQSEVECEEPGKPIAKLNWTVATNRGVAQRVDVTIFKDGFTMGEYETSKLLPPDQSSLIWEEVEPGLNHRWRLLTLQPDGWVPSETMIFKGPVCVGDEEEESTPPPIP